MKAKSILFLSLLFLGASVSSYAVTSETTVENKVQQNSLQKIRIENQQRIQQEFKSNGVDSKVSIQITGTEMDPERLKELRGLGDRIRDQVRKDLRLEFASREAKFEERIAQMKALFQKEREAFKEKLETFKDENKKAIAQNVDIQLQNVNTSRTLQFGKVLERLTGVLQQLQTKVDTAKAAGQDTTVAQSAIDHASKAIEDAHAVVASQAGKDYPAIVTTEPALRSSMSETMKTLQKDLQTTHISIQSARRAVIDAARAVYKLRIPKNESAATTSAAI